LTIDFESTHLVKIPKYAVVGPFNFTLWHGGKSAKGFSANRKQRKRIERKDFGTEGEGEMYFRYCAFR
jgi:hypothetical protein